MDGRAFHLVCIISCRRYFSGKNHPSLAYPPNQGSKATGRPRARQQMKSSISLFLVTALLFAGCDKKVSPAIEGKWVMPNGGYMEYSLALNSAGDYTLWFWSDMINSNEIPQNPKKGAYTFSDGWLVLPVEHKYRDGSSYIFSDRFKHETINGVEVLLRDDAEEIWKRSGMIYTGGLLIKISDDSNYSEAPNEPKTSRLFSRGVAAWTKEAEDAKKRSNPAPSNPQPAKGTSS